MKKKRGNIIKRLVTKEYDYKKQSILISVLLIITIPIIILTGLFSVIEVAIFTGIIMLYILIMAMKRRLIKDGLREEDFENEEDFY